MPNIIHITGMTYKIKSVPYRSRLYSGQGQSNRQYVTI